jgi:hypothetical protein
MAGEGLLEEKALREGGFSDQEISQWRGETTQQLSDAGFSGQEVQQYFGIRTPDMSEMKRYFGENLQKFNAEKQEKAANSTGSGASPKAQPNEVDGFIESLEAGFQMSVSGLIARSGAPGKVLSPDAPMASRIASQIGTMAGDLPAMIPAFVAGGVVGSAVAPGVGTAMGSMGAAFAFPAMMREDLMQKYEKGDVKSFGDYWERTSAVLWESIKQGGVGLATGAAGFAGKTLGAAAGPTASTVAEAVAEIGTMTTIGKAIEGQVPEPQDFVDAAVLLGGLKGAMHVGPKIRQIYAKTGAKPEEVWQAAEADPVIKQELAAVNIELPAAFDSRPAPESAGHQIEAARAKIREQIGEKTPAPKEGYSFNKAYTDFVDKLDPINRAAESLKKNTEILPANQNPYQLARMANDYKAKAKYEFEYGTLDFKTLEKTGKSLKEIIEPHQKELAELEAYWLSKRAIEVEARGIKSGFDLEAAKELTKADKAKYDGAVNELVKFANSGLKYMHDSGLISKEALSAMEKDGAAYASLKRVNEPGTAPKKGGGSPIKALKGSELKVQSPLLSLVENREAMIRLAEKNRAIDAFVTLAEKNPEAGLIEKVSTPMRAIEVKPEEVSRAFGEQVEGEAFTIFRGYTKDLAKDEFAVYRKGKREVYKTTPELAEAFKALDGDTTSMNAFMKLARGISTVKKLGIALTPEFVLKNIFRDQLTAGVFSKGGAIPFTDMVHAVVDRVKKNDAYSAWLKSGGANGTFMELGKSYYENNIAKLNKETGFVDKAWNVLKTPVDFMRAAAELTEQATRLAEFKRVSKGATSGSKVFEGGFASREVTVDFQRMGAKMSALNSITAFQNISIQGLDRTIRAVKENPSGVAMKAALYITAPSVLLWYANKDDKRWQELPRWQKDMFWIILTGDEKNGTIYRIPKPQELGIVFGSVPERLLEQFFTDHPNALKDFEDTMTNLITPAFVPDAISPVVETYFNKSLFTGSPIVSAQSEKNVLPEYQYTPYTSEAGKLVAKVVAALPGMKRSQLASPPVIENWVRSWGGTLGAYSLQLADKALTVSGAVKPPLKPTSTLADIPFIKAFVIRNPSASSQSIQDFYENYEKSVQDLGTIKKLAKEGDVDSLQKVMKSAELEGTIFKLSGFKDALANQNRYIQQIYANTRMTRDEKRQQIDGVYYMMIEQSRLANKMLGDAQKALTK